MTAPPRRWGRVVAVAAPAAAAALLLGAVGAMTAGATTSLASDSFARTTSGGWGKADVGGAWTLKGSAANFSVSGGAGRMTIPAATTNGAILGSVSSTDTEVTTSIVLDRVPTGSGLYTSVAARTVIGKGQYAAVLRVAPGGATTLYLVRRSAVYVDTAVSATRELPRTYSAGTEIRVRVRATGTGTTALAARAWSAADPEPSTWTVAASDTTAALQVPGGVGVSAYLSSAATSSVAVAVPDLQVAPTTTTPAPTAPPTTTAPTPPPTVAPATPRASSSAGAAAVGSTSYPVPSGALVVATNGSDTASGTIAAPVATIARAVALAKNGGTIVLRGGTYHQGASLPGDKSLTFQSYPNEAVWLDGSRSVTGWTKSGTAWLHSGWAPVFDHSPTYRSGAPDGTTASWQWVNPAYPMASYPDLAFIDGKPLTQVASLAKVVPGTFHVDTTKHVLAVGSDPTGHTISASDLQTALAIRAPGTVVRGIGIRRFATSVPLMGTVTIAGTAKGSTLENVVIQDNATQGLSVQATSVALRRVSVLRNGLLGVHADYAHGLALTSVRSSGNNTEHFNHAPVSGGLKATRTRGVTVRSSVFASNDGPGAWFDMSSYDVTVVGSDAIANKGHGLRMEISDTFVFADDVAIGNGGNGIRVQNTGHGRIWNNTIARNADRDLNILQDSRTSSDPAMPWLSQKIVVRNNVIDGTGGNALFAVEDWTKKHSASSLGISVNGDIYGRTSTAAPATLAVWCRAGTDPAAYRTVGTFRTGAGQEGSGLEVTGSLTDANGMPGATVLTQQSTVAQPLDAAIATLIGRPSGARTLGAFMS